MWAGSIQSEWKSRRKGVPSGGQRRRHIPADAGFHSDTSTSPPGSAAQLMIAVEPIPCTKSAMTYTRWLCFSAEL